MDDNSIPASDATRAFFRHTVATLAYRGEKAIANAPDTFGEFRIHETTRTPGAILAHLGDLLEWALSMAKGSPAFHERETLSWPDETARFFASLKALDNFLASDQPLGAPPEKLFQGPIADALTHVGQIAILRRMADAPIRGESYYKAEIEVGRVGPEQSTKRVEID